MQSNVIDFWSAILTDTSAFLLSEPIIHFVSIFLLLAVSKLFANIIFSFGGKI